MSLAARAVLCGFCGPPSAGSSVPTTGGRACIWQQSITQSTHGCSCCCAAPELLEGSEGRSKASKHTGAALGQAADSALTPDGLCAVWLSSYSFRSLHMATWVYAPGTSRTVSACCAVRSRARPASLRTHASVCRSDLLVSGITLIDQSECSS